MFTILQEESTIFNVHNSTSRPYYIQCPQFNKRRYCEIGLLAKKRAVTAEETTSQQKVATNLAPKRPKALVDNRGTEF